MSGSSTETVVPDLTDKDHAELLLLYQVTIDDIEKTKQWGWTVAYTTVGAQGGVLGLYTAYDSVLLLAWVQALFVALTVALGLVGVNHVRHAQASLTAFRQRIRSVREYFGPAFASTFGEPNPKKQWQLEPMIWVSSVAVSGLIVGGAGA
jgi:hypothetical protein